MQFVRHRKWEVVTSTHSQCVDVALLALIRLHALLTPASQGAAIACCGGGGKISMFAHAR